MIKENTWSVLIKSRCMKMFITVDNTQEMLAKHFRTLRSNELSMLRTTSKPWSNNGKMMTIRSKKVSQLVSSTQRARKHKSWHRNLLNQSPLKSSLRSKRNSQPKKLILNNLDQTGPLTKRLESTKSI